MSIYLTPPRKTPRIEDSSTPPPKAQRIENCPRAPFKPCTSFQDRSPAFEEMETARDAILERTNRLGIGRFHEARVDKDDLVYKVPNDDEFERSRGDGIAFKRIEHSLSNYETLQSAKNKGLLPDLHITDTTFDSNKCVIIQERCFHLFAETDLKRPEVVAKIAKIFRTAFQHNIPLDFKPDNLGWKDKERTELCLFDFLEDDVGTFRVRTKSLLEEWARGNKTLFRTLDPRPKGSKH